MPSWFSAGSFMAAGYVIIRDRRQKRRQQIDCLGIWGEFDLCQEEDAVNFGFIVPRIHLKNASDLPVYVESVEYEAVYSWSQLAHSGYYFSPFDGGVGGFAGRIRDVVVPPGREVVSYGVDRRPIGDPQWIHGDAGVTSRAPGSKMIILEVVVVDNAQRRWKLVPDADRAGLASTRVPPAGGLSARTLKGRLGKIAGRRRGKNREGY
ncbi:MULTISPECIES: hypothetical protein [unclassified Amycolatopsis]|uniref:hypothetical protein n=1 Tax=unclassified Amycolatopsis TaxID=2618356 RepID=UPI0028742251|nr:MULTISPECIES: hypothetical protein [unclassified Amycolatopsis]MDS0138694.1 hypothetical protein [Amycolatopsis sp. 505]MDS0146029.1 hypothetical protein [Amycolatopsis sp. CM201R]